MPWFETTTRSRVETAVGIILRTPGLFIIDYWWQHERSRSLPSGRSDFISAFVTNLALINGFLLLLLPLSCIRSLYSHFVCGALLLSAHLLSYYYVNVIDGNDAGAEEEHMVTVSVVETVASSIAHTAVAKQISLLAVHVVIAIVVSCLLQGPQKPLLPILACYSLPVVARLADFPSESLHVLHNFSSALVVLSLLRYAFYCLPTVFNSLKGAYSHFHHETEVQGMAAVVSALCSKLFVPTHFLLFWAVAFFIKLYEMAIGDDPSNKEWYLAVLSASSALCISPVSLFATAVAVAYMSYFALFAIKLYLWGSKTVAPRNANYPNHVHTGWEEGLTTFLLALLTGLTEMKQPARMAVLTIILFVVLSSLLQSMLEIAEPAILSLSSYHGKNFLHHVKILSLCAFLFLFPLHVTWVLAQIFPVDFWMAVVLSTSVLTSAQVLDLVVVHCLLWYDATRAEPWEALDELIYYVRGFTKIVEFFVAASVVVVGIWEGVTGQWSWTNAFILLVHCYFNVWQRFQAGLRSFLKRREAVKKSARLPQASKAQLVSYNDVCAICFTDMISESNSVVTPCNHFFHRICLRKWLCFQDTCPLCTSPINKTNSDQNLENSNSNPIEQLHQIFPEVINDEH